MAGLPFSSTDVVRAARTRFEKNFVETQGIRACAVMRAMEGKAESMNLVTGIDWNLRARAAPGSVSNFTPYSSVASYRIEPDVKLSVVPVQFVTHQAMAISDSEMEANAGNPDKLYSLYAIKRSANEETASIVRDAAYVGAGYSDTSEGLDGLMGWLRVFGRSMTSGGVFVSQPTPARNGVYVRQGNGALTSTLYGKDRSTADLSRLRTLVATHDGVVNDTMLRTLFDTALDAGFEYIDNLQGKTPEVGNLVGYWSDAFHRSFVQYMNEVGGPRTDYFFKMAAGVVQGLSMKPAPVLNTHFLAPIFIINHANLKLVKFTSRWNTPRPLYDGVDVHSEPRLWACQMRAEDPSTAGALIHGSFTTGL